MSVEQRKKMRKARKMREKQIKMYWAMGYLLVVAIGLAIFQPAHVVGS